jgi:sRNA-binding regulator protein Hfq
MSAFVRQKAKGTSNIQGHKMTSIKMTEHGFLSAHVAEKTILNAYLASGVKLSNVVLEAFDIDVLFLRSTGRGGGIQMTYKKNLSTLSPVSTRQKPSFPSDLDDMISDLVDRAALSDGLL